MNTYFSKPASSASKLTTPLSFWRGVGGEALLFLLALLTACSGGEQDVKDYAVTTVSSAPSWMVDWQSDDPRPDWQEPNIQGYENWSIMKVKIEDELKPYTSSDDRLALFVAGECRGVQGPAVVLGSSETNTTTYLLKAWGNENDGDQVDVTLKYYNARLRHVFTRSAEVTYRVGEDLGVDTDFTPQFTLGSSKYPVVTTIDVAALLAKASIMPADGDLMAAFVDGECRGVAAAGSTLTVFGRSGGERITVRYYRASTSSIYSFTESE